MPTGYTWDVANGEITELKPYILSCARAFIGFMRDAPKDAPIPTKVPRSDYHSSHLKEALEELERFKSLTEEQLLEEAEKNYQEKLQRRDEVIERSKTSRERYQSMMDQVKSWNPDPLIVPVKDFMLQQLTSSVDFDCHSDEFIEKYYPIPTRQSVDDFKKEKMEELEWNVKHHRDGLSEDTQREDQGDQWLSAFHSSLPE